MANSNESHVNHRVFLLEKQVRLLALENEKMRRGIDNALPLIRAGMNDRVAVELTEARKRGQA